MHLVREMQGRLSEGSGKMMAEEAKNMPGQVSLSKRITYGAMGSAAAVASMLAASCASRCNGCMGCLAGGAGIVGILAGSKIVEKFSGKGRETPANQIRNFVSRGLIRRGGKS